MTKRQPAILAATTLAAAVTVTGLAGLATARAGDGCPPPITIAHRGENSLAPEETRPAIIAALRGGANAVEFDVRLSRSGTPYLMHDATVDRTTNGTGTVGSKSDAQMNALDAGSWFSGATYARAVVPTAYDALKRIANYPGRIAVPELKGSWSDANLAKFAKIVADTGMTKRVVVQSFSPTTLARLRVKAPTLSLGLLSSTAPADPVAAVRAARASYWLPAATIVTQGHVDALHAAGMKVWTWSSNTPSEWSRLSTMGVDGIMTDRAARYEGWQTARCGVAP